MSGYFKNVKGFNCVPDPEKSTWWETVYEFQLDLNNPLTFVDKNGDQWQPNRHFWTNQGSIPRFPPFIRMIIPKDRFLGFYIHDSAYDEGGLWKWKLITNVASDGMITFSTKGEFVELSRHQIDELLYEMMLADPEKPFVTTAKLVYQHVRLYGGWCFKKAKKLNVEC